MNSRAIDENEFKILKNEFKILSVARLCFRAKKYGKIKTSSFNIWPVLIEAH